MADAPREASYWSQDASVLAAALGAGLGGLTSARAAAQLALVGPNSVEDAPRLSALRLLLRQFESPLVLILVFAAAISLVLRQWVDAGIILAIVLGSTLLGFFQEYRASAAVEELKRRLALTCRVVRDGLEQTVPVSTDRAGRHHPALGRQPDPRRRPRDRGGGLPGQRGEPDRRILPGREAARDRSAGRADRRADQRGLPRRLGAQRHGEGSRGQRPVAGPRSARSRRGSGRARPRRSSRGASGSSATC